MSTAAQGQSTTDSRTMALAMFADQVPCALQFYDPSCPKTARWLAYSVHEENTTACDYNEPMLLCDEHKVVMQRALAPFWRMWHNLPPMLCVRCETPIRLDRFEAI